MKYKVLAMDVDGTLTDGKIYMGNDGELFKAFDIKDGLGIHDILIPSGIIPVIITGRKSKILENRCREIGITNLYQGVSNKIEKLQQFLESIDASLSETAYIGDDLNDMAVMKLVKENGGYIGCPKDATKEVLNSADYICKRNGGCGAVREFIEIIVVK